MNDRRGAIDGGNFVMTPPGDFGDRATAELWDDGSLRFRSHDGNVITSIEQEPTWQPAGINAANTRRVDALRLHPTVRDLYVAGLIDPTADLRYVLPNLPDLLGNGDRVLALVQFIEHHIGDGLVRAIWQLHKPTWRQGFFACLSCWDGAPYDSTGEDWPCATVGAVLDFYESEPTYDPDWLNIGYSWEIP